MHTHTHTYTHTQCLTYASTHAHTLTHKHTYTCSYLFMHARTNTHQPPQEAYRDWVMGQGKVANRNRLKQNLPACPVPKRVKSNWDHVLEEMEWLAKDFQRFVYVCVCALVYMLVSAYACVHVCVYVCVYLCLCVCVCVCACGSLSQG